ncbi:MAG: hypothetical protein N2689_00170 [Verrucomicrobiae bacterium]|nr:hypothetical protein [Verrucomicrobiae bacterium]
MARKVQWLLTTMALALSLTTAEAAQLAVRLVHASNTAPAKEDKELAENKTRLVKAFGWREYQVLSHVGASLKEGGVKQLDLGHQLALRVKLLKAGGKDYLLRCELLRGEENLVQTTATISSGSAFFITGPPYQEGQLLISIAIR